MRRRIEPAREFVPNLAPMVDVIMVLLVFFLLGATLNLAEQGLLRTELDPTSGPHAGQAIEIHPRIRIGLQNVDDGRAVNVLLIDQALGEDAFERLSAILRSRRAAGADPQNPVVIAAETTVRWKFVVRAMDAAVGAGFQNIQFAVSAAPIGEVS